MSNPAAQPAKSVAEIEQDLEKARALEREQSSRAHEAERVQLGRARLRDDLSAQLETRHLQIANTRKWLAERESDAKALGHRIQTEFADLKSNTAAA